MKGYYWWLAPNGMIGQYRKNPGKGWRGPYDTIRDLKEANNNIQFGTSGCNVNITIEGILDLDTDRLIKDINTALEDKAFKRRKNDCYKR
jgi:hypothetical protein